MTPPHDYIFDLPLRPYTFGMLCRIYNLSPKTMRVNLSKISDKLERRPAEIYDINQVILIIEKLDVPAPFPAEYLK